jgi:hypothetical protein
MDSKSPESETTTVPELFRSNNISWNREEKSSTVHVVDNDRAKVPDDPKWMDENTSVECGWYGRRRRVRTKERKECRGI